MKVTRAQRRLLNRLCNPKHFDALCFLAVSAYIFANRNVDDAAIANGLSDRIEQVVKQTTRKRKRSHRLSKSAAFCDLVPERLVQKTLAFVSEVSSKSQDRSAKQKSKKRIPKHDYLNDRNEVERHPFNPPVRAITSTPELSHVHTFRPLLDLQSRSSTMKRSQQNSAAHYEMIQCRYIVGAFSRWLGKKAAAPSWPSIPDGSV